MRKAPIILLCLLTVLGLAEAGTRLLGIANVPIRDANTITGYIPLPSQSGRFLNHDWTINKLSMISRAEYKSSERSIILAGDSVVFGGNPLKQSERVGELLTGVVGEPVFSIADGSWGLKNALAYFLTRKEALGDPKQIVFVINSGDMEKPSAWRCFSHHPTSRPISAFYFSARKYLLPECENETPFNLVVRDFSIESGLASFLKLYPDTKVTVVLYPALDEFRSMNSFAPRFSEAAGKLDQRITLIDLLDVIRNKPALWKAEYYLDAIHPNAQGTKALAHLIVAFVLKSER